MKLDRFLVCGLGSLGQHCVLALQQFGVKIVAIEQVAPQSWEVPNLVNLLDDLIIGDCRENNVLAQAQIHACRAAIIVTGNEGVNAEIALAIRQLNPQTRLVVRSAKTNLNQLLSQQLGNFIAYEPIELPAHSFAIAALGTDTVGFFNLDGYWLQVVRQRMSPDHPWCNARRLHQIDTRSQKLLAHNGSATDSGFYKWQFEELVTAGDLVTYIEIADRFSLHATSDRPIAAGKKTKQPQIARWVRRAIDRFMQFWRSNFQQQVRRVALICCLIVVLLLAIATVLFHQYYPNTTWVSAFGENILNLFHIDRQTILVTEYTIEAGDTLDRLLLAEVAYGYGVVPVLHQRSPNPATLMPTDDILLANGDRLVVLATTESLRRIDIGDRYPKSWQVEVELAMTAESTFEGANIIGRISGCSLRIARDLIENLPGILDIPLYQHQAQRLVYGLEKVRVKAKIVSGENKIGRC